jgi:5-methylcytosine-specific restriction endonuclease McrA
MSKMSKRDPVTHRTPEQMRRHYDEYQGTPEQIAKRSQRNKARRMVEKKLGKAALKDKDVHHVTPIRSGGSNSASNLRLVDKAKNRGWRGR